MNGLSAWWDSLLARPIEWELVFRFLDILIWPVVVVIGLAAVRPWRLIDAMIANGGELALPGGAIRLAKTVAEVSERLGEDEETAEIAQEPPTPPPAATDSDPYDIVMGGWSRVIMGLELAAAAGEVGRVSRMDPMAMVRRLRHEDLIGRKLANNIEDLWDVRNKVKRATPRGLDRIGFRQTDADAYYAAAEKVRKGIGRAIGLREGRGRLQRVAASVTSIIPGISDPARPN